jgi:hypothetical protein
MKVTSMKGVPVDFARYIAQNEDSVAVGNGRMNARGDQIGRGGKVVKGRDEVAADYYRSNPKAVKKVAITDLPNEMFVSPADALKSAEDKGAITPRAPSRKKISETDTED